MIIDAHELRTALLAEDQGRVSPVVSGRLSRGKWVIIGFDGVYRSCEGVDLVTHSQ